MASYDDEEDYSDLTDIESDDYAVSSSRKKSTARIKSAASSTGGFRIKNALKVPRPTTYTVQALYDQIHSSDINLEPDYQRDVVWPEAKQIGIIDSIFRNFYIPPVIFAVSTDDDGSESRTCIDGKQRLTSLYRFMDGLIPHKDPFTGEKLWYKDVGPTKGTKKKKLLPEKYRRLFANKQIVCVEYHDITDQDEREIFQRVQLGMALTPAEKLQVINSPRAQFVRELQASYLKEEGGGLATSALDWDRSRGADFRCLSQALYTIDRYSTLKTAPTVLQLEKWLSEDQALPPIFQKGITETFDILVLLVHEKTTKVIFKKPTKVSPIEFILIVVLIAIWKEKMSLAELSEAIGKMREDVRVVHADIRMNTKVTKTMLDFMRGLKASKTAPEQTASAVARARPPPVASSRDKRKRVTERMDVDGGAKGVGGYSTDPSDSSEDEQLAKKVKRMGASVKSAYTTSGSGAGTGQSLPNLRPTLTSGPSTTSRSATALATTTQTQAPSQPTAIPTQPKMDRLAGVRAARAASTGLARPPVHTSLPPKPINTSNGNSTQSGTPLPSPSLPFAGFRGGIGAPIRQPQPSSMPPLHLPPTQHNVYASQPLPPPSLPPQQQLFRQTLSTPQSASTSTLTPFNPIPLPATPSHPSWPASAPAFAPTTAQGSSGLSEREQWELDRYGRIQKGYVPDNGWNAPGIGGGKKK